MSPIRNDLKEGEALSPLLFNFALQYAVGKVQVKHDGLQLSGTRNIMVCTDDVGIYTYYKGNHRV
jgi:hypothetical protein